MTRKSLVEPIHLNVEDRNILQQELDLITILHHRNKNQHHGATWYKYIKILKTSIARIIATSETLVGSGSSKVRNDAAVSREQHYIRERSAFLSKVRSMYQGFTQIIGTGQYVPLGLILLGILSRVWKVILGKGGDIPIADNVMADEIPDVSMSTLDTKDVDVGVVLRRQEDGAIHERTSVSTETKQTSKPTTEEPSSNIPTIVAGVDQTSTIAPTSSRRAVSSPSNQRKTVANKKRKKQTKLVDEIDSIFG